jgi:lipopolysaccharide biosynthesis glycosyltransferase
MKDIIPIVLSCNDSYLKYAAVTIQSILENCSQNYRYIFYILANEKKLSLEAKDQFLKTSTTRAISFIIKIIDINDKIIPKLRVMAQITQEAYFRLLISNILDNDKIIYLDCDIIVKHDISKLFEIDIGDNYIAAVRDMLGIDFQEYVKTLDLLPENYFNSGVLIINNKLWKDFDVGNKCIEKLVNNPKIKFMDQDALNIVCKNKVYFLDRRWNFFWYYSIEFVKQKGILDHEIQNIYNELSNDFYIIHYTSAYKPWKKRYFKFADLWWMYAKLTIAYKQLFWDSELVSRYFLRRLIGSNNIKISGEKYKILYICFLQILIKK